MEMEERMERIEIELAECKAVLDKVLEYMVKADKTIELIGTEVAPMLDDIRTGGVMKLLGGFGKKK
jgi:uncharacterized coiled-coil protein SlyX